LPWYHKFCSSQTSVSNTYYTGNTETGFPVFGKYRQNFAGITGIRTYKMGAFLLANLILI
jgi:hypothetical protein